MKDKVFSRKSSKGLFVDGKPVFFLVVTLSLKAFLVKNL